MLAQVQEKIQAQKVNLLDGKLNPSEAGELLSTFLNTHIQFHKRQYLINWEKDHSLSSEFVTEKVAELNEAKSDLKEIISLAQEEGYEISIDGVLEIKLTK